MRDLSGFHLIELLIVLTIVSIVTALGLPIYSHYFVQTNRLQAAHVLSEIAIAMEEYYMQHQTYQGASLSQLHFSELKNNYRYRIQSANDHDYWLMAIPQGKQKENDQACGTLSCNSLGEKRASGLEKIENCW